MSRLVKPERPLTVDALIRDAAGRFPGKDAVIDPDERLTYEQLDTSTRELASTLIGAGIGTGTRVALMAPNSVRWVQLSLAITRIGAPCACKARHSLEQLITT